MILDKIGFKINTTFVHFHYRNGIVETSSLVRESDRELKCNNRTIIKDTSHGEIDERGKRHFHVWEHENNTSFPFELQLKTEFEELNNFLKDEEINIEEIKNKKDKSEEEIRLLNIYNQKVRYKPLEREAVHDVMRANLIKNLVHAQAIPLMTILMILVAGAGIGYILGSEYGGDETYYNDSTTNYNQETKEENGTIILSLMDFKVNLWINYLMK